MTGAHLSVASRRADGLATSAVLDQKYLPHAIETTRRRFEHDVIPARIPSYPRGPSFLRRQESRGTREKRGHTPFN